MTIKINYASLVAFAALMLTSGMAAAQANVAFIADPVAPADFNLAANWESGDVPVANFNENAFITNGGTAFLNAPLSGTFSAAGGLFVGPTSTFQIQSAGSLELAIRTEDPILTDRSALIQGTLSVQGAGFLEGQNLTFAPTSMINLDLTGSTSTPLRSVGTTNLGGALNLDYSGLVNPTGSQVLAEAGSFAGAFANVNSTGLNPAQSVFVDEVASTTGGSPTLQATIFNQLVLQVNRDTNDITVVNPHSTAVELDGFAIQSASGSLVGANFAGLGNGFSGGVPNDNVVSELFEGVNTATPAFAFPANSSTSIGSDLFLRGAPLAFQSDPEDLVFTFTAPGAEAPLEGVVEYLGAEAPINNDIVLTIDGAGQGALLNTSAFPQEIEAYRITSADGSLTSATWNSLADQGVDGGIWSEASFSGADTLFEISEGDVGGNDSTTFAFTPDGVFDLGTIFNIAGDQNGVVFEFLLEGGTEFTTGSVVFGDLPDAPPLIGDYNGDGTVNTADYAVWRENLGGDPLGLLNRSPFVSGPVSVDDYDEWVANAGSSLPVSAFSAVAVPEPSGFVAGVLAATLFTASSRRRERDSKVGR